MKNKSDWVERRNKKDWFVCHGCGDMIKEPQHWSKEEGYCIYCYKRREAIRNNKCLSCGGENPIDEYWSVCQKCWDKQLKEDEIKNKKIAEREAKKLGISVEEYERREAEEDF